MNQKSHEVFIGCEKEFSDAEIVLFGAPFDGTVSYRPGTRFGPHAMRSESYGLETYSPYQDADLEEASVCDMGDLDLSFGNSTRTISDIERWAEEILDKDKLPFLLGGEHLVTLGSVRAAMQKYPQMHLIHFDAHADLRDDYLGEKLSHASVIRRCHDLLGDGRIHQFGIRSGDREEFSFAKEHTFLVPYHFTGLDEKLERLGRTPLYLTVDLDVMDPSVFPGTGTPEPGGASFDDVRRAVEAVCSEPTSWLAMSWSFRRLMMQAVFLQLRQCKLVREMLIALTRAHRKVCK